MMPQVPFSISPSYSSSLIQQPPSNFFALGDSYSAGIGASCGWLLDEFDLTGSCMRCTGAYPHQISNMTGSTEVYHIACTGALIQDMQHPDENNRTAQLDFMRSKSKPGQGGDTAEWGTLTIGGNDVGFASVVVNCIAYSRASCDSDLNSTEAAIKDPRFLSQLVETYRAVLDASSPPNFRLIVPGYAQFFNARTEVCDGKFLWFGRYLTQDLRERVNAMVAHLNIVIQVAVAVAQMQLVFSNSRKAIFYEDWDSLFEGHRFCEESSNGSRSKSSWADAWFFTIQGADTLPNSTAAVSADLDLDLLNLDVQRLKELDCAGNIKDDPEQKECDLAVEQHFEKDGRRNRNVTVNGYPWWAMKTMHPKSIAHFELGKKIYEKWIDGEYF